MGSLRFVLFLVALEVAVGGQPPLTVAQPVPTPLAAHALPPVRPVPCSQAAMPGPGWDAAALVGCRSLKSLITPGNSKILGFDKPDDAAQAEIEAPYTIYTIGLDALRAYKPGDSVASMIKQIDSRIYPLSVREASGRHIVRSSLVISLDKRSNQLITSGWGLKKLIRLVTDHHNKDPQFSFIVWIPALNLHFLGNNENRIDESLMLKPLATRKLYGLEEGKPVPAAVVFAILSQQARAHDASNPG